MNLDVSHLFPYVKIPFVIYAFIRSRIEKKEFTNLLRTMKKKILNTSSIGSLPSWESTGNHDKIKLLYDTETTKMMNESMGVGGSEKIPMGDFYFDFNSDKDDMIRSSDSVESTSDLPSRIGSPMTMTMTMTMPVPMTMTMTNNNHNSYHGHTKIYVVKRNGKEEGVSFDKITARLNKLADIEPVLNNVDVVKVAQKVVQDLYPGIYTWELDNLAAETAAYKNLEHPEYALLASRIAVSNLHKLTESNFLIVTRTLHNYIHPETGEPAPLVSDEHMQLVEKHHERLQKAIVYDRDYGYDFFGFKTLEKSYLLRVNGKIFERPQHMLMRVSLGIHGSDIERALETYELMSKRYFIHATPTLFNAGTPCPQMSSCFLLTILEDSIEGIYDTLKQCALISKAAGGIGVFVGNVRAARSYIRGTNGQSNGLVPMLRVYNDTARYVDQCLRGDSMVRSERGWIPIEQVQEGKDRLYNELGQLDLVRKVKEFHYEGKVHFMRLKGIGFRLCASPEHPVMALRISEKFNMTTLTDRQISIRLKKGQLTPEWVDIEDVQDNDLVAFPNLNNIELPKYRVEEEERWNLSKSIDTDLQECVSVQHDGFSYCRIEKSEVIQHKGLLYDLEMENTEVANYMSISGLVHNGGGKRKGAIAVYVEPWHADIYEFLALKKNTGKEEVRARDLFYGLWIPDLFMKRVQQKGKWSLFCPNEAPGLHDVWGEEFEKLYERYEYEGKYRIQVDATHLWGTITASQVETGNPYMLYKDHCNRKSNQRNLGTIHCSNLCCVAGTQRVPTQKGMLTVEQLYKENSDNVIVGREQLESASEMLMTIPMSEMVRVHTEEGYTHDVTPDHPVWIFNEGWREARYLKPGDRLTMQSYEGLWGTDECLDAYDIGCAQSGAFLFKEDPDNVRHHFLRNINKEHVYEKIWKCSREWVCEYLQGLFRECRYDISKKVIFQGDDDNGGNTEFLIHHGFRHESRTFLEDVQVLLSNFGMCTNLHKDNINVSENKKIYWCLIANAHNRDTDILKSILDNTMCYPLNCCSATDNSFPEEQTVTFSRLEQLPLQPAYCLKVHTDEHSWVCNGLVTKNTEIVEYTSKDEVAVCNLASIALPRFVRAGQYDYSRLAKVCKVMVRNLNMVIDRNYYPVPEARQSNMRNRPIGIGAQGLADTFLLLGMAFDSAEAKQVNQRIFETLYYASVEASTELAEQYGPYETYEGSPMSEGLLQPDLWSVKPTTFDMWDWDALRSRVRKHGVRNSLLMAPMPTASTSQILGFNECFEPFTSNLYTRRVLSGEFILINKYLVQELIGLGKWNDRMRNTLMANKGSVQAIEGLSDDMKARYKTAFELKQKVLQQMSADRGAFICQSQSYNVFMVGVTTAKLNSMHFNAWKLGLKTGMYYLRTKSAVNAIQFTVKKENDNENVKEKKKKPVLFEIDRGTEQMESCPEDCLSCGS